MRSVNVIKNSFFYSLSIILQGMVSFFLLPIYTRFLIPADYAMLALVTSFTGIISSLITLQIHTSIPRFVIKFLKNEERAKIYFTSIFVLLFIILFFSCLSINIFGGRIIKILFSDRNEISFAPLFLIATWALLPNLLVGAGILLLQALEEGNKFFLVNLMQVMVNIILGLYFVAFLKIGIIGVLYAQLISCCVGLLSVVWFTKHWFKWDLHKIPLRDIKDSLQYSLPIIPHMLSMYIYMYSDRLILQRFVPLSDIGIYSIASTFAYVLLVIVNATTTAYSPRFLKLAEQNKTEARNETRNFIEIWWLVIMAIFVGYLLLSKYIVMLMTRPSFYPSIPLIPILTTAYIFRGLYCFSANGIFYIEKTKLIPVITISAALINVMLNMIFIPKFGIYAAAWNTVISYFITFVLSFYFSQKYFPLSYPWRNMLKVVSLAAILYFAKIIFEKTIPEYLLLRFLLNIALFLIFVCSAAMILYREYSFKTLKLFLSFFRGYLNILQNIR